MIQADSGLPSADSERMRLSREADRAKKAAVATKLRNNRAQKQEDATLKQTG